MSRFLMVASDLNVKDQVRKLLDNKVWRYVAKDVNCGFEYLVNQECVEIMRLTSGVHKEDNTVYVMFPDYTVARAYQSQLEDINLKELEANIETF